MQQRTQRVAALIREELSRIIQVQMHDPRLGFLTITGVRLSADLRHAQVYIAILETADSNKKDVTLEVLQGARGYLRSELSRSLPLRHIPDLNFLKDDSSQRSERIEQLLRGQNPAGGADEKTPPDD